jgi:hypothetical protein
VGARARSVAPGINEGRGVKEDSDPFDLDKLRLPDQILGPTPTPRKIAKRREHFVMVPFEWLERLNGAEGSAYAVALHLLYLNWKGRGGPVKLANGMLKINGINRWSKKRALEDLERRGLITVERRPRKSPIIRLI